MQGFLNLKQVFDYLLNTRLVERVYHSVEIIEDTNGTKCPVYPINPTEFSYVGIDDTKVMNVYCRQIGDLKAVGAAVKLTSDLKLYKTSVAQRLVFFNRYESRNNDELINTFMQFIFFEKIKFLRLITDKEALAALETTPKAFTFDNSSFYCAIDFEVEINLNKDNCSSQITCGNLPNPYCKPTNP